MLKVERGGGDANDPCKHYHPSLSQSIYQRPGCTFGRILAPDTNFMPKPMLHQVVMPYTIPRFSSLPLVLVQARGAFIKARKMRLLLNRIAARIRDITELGHLNCLNQGHQGDQDYQGHSFQGYKVVTHAGNYSSYAPVYEQHFFTKSVD